MIIEIVIIFFTLLFGSFVQGVSGFGFGLVAMSILPFFFTVKESTLLVISLALVISTSIALQMVKHIQWRSLFVILAAAIVGRIGGFFILHHYGEMEILKVFLGVFLVLVVIYLFTKKPPKPDTKVNETWLPILLGLAGGAIGGIFAVGGPFFVFFFLLLYHDNKYTYTANLQVTFVVTSVITVVLHGTSDDFSMGFLSYFLVGLFSVLLGSRIGIHFFKRISHNNIKKIAGVVVAIAALNLIIFG